MISVEQALEKILATFQLLEPEYVPIMDTLGQVLAEDIRSEITVPPWDNSAMDGYAVLAADTAGATANSPKTLKVIDTVIAGSISRKTVTAGTAIRIMTGAPLPKGADAVVQFEDTDEEDRRKAGKQDSVIAIRVAVKPHLNVRDAGEDIRSGDLVLEKGTLIRPAEVGVLASLGMAKVHVTRRPVIAVLSTGNELAAVGAPVSAGKIYNSNSYSVAGLVKKYGAIPLMLGIARDSVDSLVAALSKGLTADMIITTGGVSAGDYDMVKNVLAAEGEINFWTVRMKPGKPLAFGFIRGSDRKVPLLGLPGNPVSSMVTFELFGRAAIMKMMGIKEMARPVVDVELAEGRIDNRDDRRVYSRAIVTRKGNKYNARLTGPQGSGMLTSMSRANALVILAEDRKKAVVGDILPAIMLDWIQPIEMETGLS